MDHRVLGALKDACGFPTMGGGVSVFPKPHVVQESTVNSLHCPSSILRKVLLLLPFYKRKVSQTAFK